MVADGSENIEGGVAYLVNYVLKCRNTDLYSRDEFDSELNEGVGVDSGNF